MIQGEGAGLLHHLFDRVSGDVCGKDQASAIGLDLSYEGRGRARKTRHDGAGETCGDARKLRLISARCCGKSAAGAAADVDVVVIIDSDRTNDRARVREISGPAE